MDADGVRCSEKGLELLAAQDALDSAPTPASPDEAWAALLAVAEPFSALEERVQWARADLETRGIARSGPAIVEVMRLATAAGFRWNAEHRRFERPWWDRARGKLIGVAGTLAAALPVVFRGDATSMAEAVGAGHGGRRVRRPLLRHEVQQADDAAARSPTLLGESQRGHLTVTPPCRSGSYRGRGA